MAAGKVIAALLILDFALLSGSALAADLTGRSIPKSTLSCRAWGDSKIATLSTLEEMHAALRRYYRSATFEANRSWTINASSNRYIWAVQATHACGTAIGYVKTGEVNQLRFWNCECYYARMLDEHPH